MLMVGDVKQSIYKFRQAMPKLFLDKYSKYKLKEERHGNENLKIQLFNNFRSRENILKFTNLIFRNIMSNELGEIDYTEKEYLNLGTHYPETKQNLKTEINIINLNEELEEKRFNYEENDEFDDEEENNQKEQNEERIENVELEARFVANKIKELIDNKFQIWDRKKHEFRDIEYRDIVVLLRTTSNVAQVYEQEMLKLDIPVFSDSSQEYLDSIEIQTIMNLLKIIDNPVQDIPLVTVMRSNIGKFTDNELVEIRLSDKHDNFYNCLQKARVNVNIELKNKIDDFLCNLSKWRKEKEYLSLDELIWKIYMDTGYYNYVNLMPNGVLRVANLKMLFERAKQYEKASFKGLYNFINFIEKLKLNSGDLGAAKIIGENDNVIRIMSIHKSKGLEFPVVFLSNTGKQFNLTDMNMSILLHQKLGLGVKYIDSKMQICYDTLTKLAIKNKVLLETMSEEMRILYVALTRSKEKLFITGIEKNFQKKAEELENAIKKYERLENKINPILVQNYKRYLDWILLVYFYEKDNTKDLIDFNVLNKNETLSVFQDVKKEEIDVTKILEKMPTNNEKINNIDKILSYKYKYSQSINIPTKTSVTELKNLESKTEDIKFMEKTFPIPNFIKSEEEKNITSTIKGTIMHLCMQNLNEKQEYDLDEVKKLINGLETKGIITKQEAESVNPFKILEFTKSNIWKDLKTAKEVYKEKPFYINIPASEIYNNEDLKENVLVQGIIDLYYIDKDDNLVLLDYKTDFVEQGKEEELVKKYEKQLEIYKKALESALNRKVDKVYIYSIYLGKEI